MIYQLKVIKIAGTHFDEIEARNVTEAEEMVRCGEFEGGEFPDENLKVVLTGVRCKPREIVIE